MILAFEQTIAKSSGNEFRCRVNIKLAHKFCAVPVHGIDANVQTVGDLRITFAADNGKENLSLPPRQLRAINRLIDQLQNGIRNFAFAITNRRQIVNPPIGIARLHENAFNAAVIDMAQQFLSGHTRQNRNLCLGAPSAHFLDYLYAGRLRHSDIENNKIGPLRFNQRHCAQAVFRFADNNKVRRSFNHLFNAASHQHMIVGYDD